MCPAHEKTESPVAGLGSQRPLIQGREASPHLFCVTQEWNIILFFEVLVCAKSLQSCPTLCDPIDCSPPGSSVHGNLQARVWKWVARPSYRGSSRPRNQTCLLHCWQILYHWGTGKAQFPPYFLPYTYDKHFFLRENCLRC